MQDCTSFVIPPCVDVRGIAILTDLSSVFCFECGTESSRRNTWEEVETTRFNNDPPFGNEMTK